MGGFPALCVCVGFSPHEVPPVGVGYAPSFLNDGWVMFRLWVRALSPGVCGLPSPWVCLWVRQVQNVVNASDVMTLSTIWIGEMV